MPLTGEAKKNYQREYMRKRRGSNAESLLDPKAKALAVLDQTIDKCNKGLESINGNLEKVVETMRKKRKYTKKPKFLIIPKPLPGKTLEETADVYRKIIDSTACPTCGGKGFIEYEAGLVEVQCECQK